MFDCTYTLTQKKDLRDYMLNRKTFKLRNLKQNQPAGRIKRRLQPRMMNESQVCIINETVRLALCGQTPILTRWDLYAAILTKTTHAYDIFAVIVDGTCKQGWFLNSPSRLNVRKCRFIPFYVVFNAGVHIKPLNVSSCKPSLWRTERLKQTAYDMFGTV